MITSRPYAIIRIRSAHVRIVTSGDRCAADRIAGRNCVSGSAGGDVDASSLLVAINCKLSGSRPAVSRRRQDRLRAFLGSPHQSRFGRPDMAGAPPVRVFRDETRWWRPEVTPRRISNSGARAERRPGQSGHHADGGPIGAPRRRRLGSYQVSASTSRSIRSSTFPVLGRPRSASWSPSSAFVSPS